jgi:hypothetical protein
MEMARNAKQAPMSLTLLIVRASFSIPFVATVFLWAWHRRADLFAHFIVWPALTIYIGMLLWHFLTSRPAPAWYVALACILIGLGWSVVLFVVALFFALPNGCMNC